MLTPADWLEYLDSIEFDDDAESPVWWIDFRAIPEADRRKLRAVLSKADREGWDDEEWPE